MPLGEREPRLVCNSARGGSAGRNTYHMPDPGFAGGAGGGGRVALVYDELVDPSMERLLVSGGSGCGACVRCSCSGAGAGSVTAIQRILP